LNLRATIHWRDRVFGGENEASKKFTF